MKKQTGIDLNMINEILDSCLEVGLFNQEIFDQYGIITSRGIQKRFYMAAQKRKEVEIIPEYVLHDKLLRWFDDDNTEETPQEVGENSMSEEVNSEETLVEEPKPESYPGINPEETPPDEELPESNRSQSAEECRLNDVKSTQSKVKESKVKNSKVKRDKTGAPKVPKFIYAENVLMTEAECQKLIKKHGQAATDWMIDALDNYKGAHGKKYASDYRAILSWVVGKYEEQKSKGRKPAERSEVNDSVESDLAGRDWNKF
jgi:hypothetical protein